MYSRKLVVAVALLIAFLCARSAVRAEGIAPYETFVKGAEAQRGLFTLWHKDGKLYFELAAAQLGKDFVQTIVPSTGIGGQGVVSGNTDHLPTELLRFERAGNNVAILWPNPFFIAPRSAASQRAIEGNFARSIVGLAPIVASDAKTGALVVDAAPFLEDQLNLKAVLRQNVHDRPKAEPYTLDKDRSYFGTTKAFPKNVVIEALQDWTAEDQRIEDAVPDPRHVQMRVVYNMAELPPLGDYRPRLADDRVGIYNDIYLSFDNDRVLSRKLRYLVRWNLQPSDPSKPISPAKHPMVFYLSNTIPEQYRPAIRAAVLKWNDAFMPLGISDALQVVDQPNDPAWDVDDIRYNLLRWVPEYSASFGADSQTLYDPRTGEEFRTGILISADVPLFAQREWTYAVDPVRFGRTTDAMPQRFLDDDWLAVILHETGHNLGMQHNFIGSRAYTAKQLQDKNFTSKYGIASTVMEYAPTNLWPKPFTQGDYFQTTLGPYDYYAMHFAYADIPGTRTPEEELPTLQRWASAWSDPKFRYASDEDVAWATGHAADPRAEQGILTSDMFAWCDVQLKMNRDLMARAASRFPASGEAYEAATDAFATTFGRSAGCELMPAHFIGGQYLSRAHRGDPGAEAPVVPVPRTEQRRAFEALDRNLFSAGAWRFSAALLAHLGTSEWAGYGYVGLEGYGNLPHWAYNPPERHDIAVSERIGRLQNAAIAAMFAPLVLARMAENPAETNEAHPMLLADLFAWMHASVYRELREPTPGIEPLRRALQQRYLETLTALYQKPDPVAPADARALARSELVSIAQEAGRAARSAAHDTTTRAHLELLAARAREALHPAGADH